MQARMKNPAFIHQDAMAALQALGVVCRKSSDIPESIHGLLHLRASQINGCAFCLDMHIKQAKKNGEDVERLFAVSVWRESPLFTGAERAALALTEAVTRVADQADPVPDPVWAEAARHFDEKAMATLLLAIATINVWNRLNVATRQIPGEVKWEEHVKK